MCFSLAKYFLFAFNFIFWCAGAGMVGVGIWLNVDSGVSNTVEVAGISFYIAGSIVMIVAGAIMLVVGFFGCCGAIKESTCLLQLYFGCLFVILGIEVGLGIWAFIVFPSVNGLIDDSFSKIDLTDPESNDAIVTMEQNLECCGATEGCTDWSSAASYGCACKNTESANCEVAKTIGCDPDSNTKTNPDKVDTIYVQPCSNATISFIEDNFQVLAYVTLIIGCTQVVGLILAACLCSSIKKSNKTY